MDFIQKRVTSIIGLAPLWFYKLTRNGRRYFQLLDKIHSFTANVLKEKKAARELKKTRENGYSNAENNDALTDNDSSMGLSNMRNTTIDFTNRFLVIFFYKIHRKTESISGQIIGHGRRDWRLSEERMLNQVDTFMFAVKAIC